MRTIQVYNYDGSKGYIGDKRFEVVQDPTSEWDEQTSSYIGKYLVPENIACLDPETKEVRVDKIKKAYKILHDDGKSDVVKAITVRNPKKLSELESLVKEEFLESSETLRQISF